MKDAEIVVSVIVLTYNHKKYIKQALDSILAQKTDYLYEILVGDDASSDGTSAIVQTYAQKYPRVVRVFIRESNLGATNNLYNLFQYAKGKYIANCEGDDFWCDSNKLQRQVDFLEAHPDYSACTHNCCIVNENGVIIENQILPWVCTKEEYTIKDFKGIYLPGQPATLVHHNFFLNKKHDYSIIREASPVIGDRTVVLILSAMGKIRRFPETMSCYRVSSGTENATSFMFRNNPNVNQMQYELTCKLEQYAHDEFGICLHFTRFKIEQLIKKWIKMLLKYL